MNVAIVSFDATGGPAATRKRLLDNLEMICRLDVDLVCFPELACPGWITDDYSDDLASAYVIPGPFTKTIGAIAGNHGKYIALGVLERERGMLYDTAILVDPDGKLALRYRRVTSTWRLKNAECYREGKEVGVVPTPFGRVAFLLCGDLFDDQALDLAREKVPDFVIYLLARSVNSKTYNQSEWVTELAHYQDRVRQLGCGVFFSNLYTGNGEDDFFGGAGYIDKHGQLHVNAPVGRPGIQTLSVTLGSDDVLDKDSLLLLTDYKKLREVGLTCPVQGNHDITIDALTGEGEGITKVWPKQD